MQIAHIKHICVTISGHIWLYIYIYSYIYIYICLLAGDDFIVTSSHDCSTLPPDVGALGSDTLHCWLFFSEPVLWKCSYGPWDHFMFSVKSWIWLVFYQSDPALLGKHRFPFWLSICKDPSSWFSGKKALICWRKALISWEGCLFFWDSHCGHIVSVNSANSVFQ